MKVNVDKSFFKYRKFAKETLLYVNDINSEKNDEITLPYLYFAMLADNSGNASYFEILYEKCFKINSNVKRENRSKIINRNISLKNIEKIYTSLLVNTTNEEFEDLIFADYWGAKTKYSHDENDYVALYYSTICYYFAKVFGISNNKIIDFAKNTINRILNNDKNKTSDKKSKNKISLSQDVVVDMCIYPLELTRYSYIHEINLTKDYINCIISTVSFYEYIKNDIFVNNDNLDFDDLFEEELSYLMEGIVEENREAIEEMPTSYITVIDTIEEMHFNSCKQIVTKNLSTLESENSASLLDIMTAFEFISNEEIESKREVLKNKSFKKFINTNHYLRNISDVIEDSQKTILGRDKEIRQTLISLSKQIKSNVILIGEAGVGKTAIVEELAREIKFNEIPKFEGYCVIEFDVTSLLSGTKFRGELEAKLERFIEYFSKNKDLKVILFIDEIHKIMGAGSGSEESTLDVSNMLKPLLARDNIKLIGATTNDEYEKYICRDKAVARRFDTLKVDEPSIEKVPDMIKVKVENLSKYHNVSITSEDIKYILEQADTKLKNRCFPDKALDVIDYCMAESAFDNKKAFDKGFVEAYIENISEKKAVKVGY